MGVINSPTDTINALSFTIDGRYLASTSDDKTVRVHDIERGSSKVWEHKGAYPYTAVAWKNNILFIGDEAGVVMCSYPTLVSSILWWSNFYLNANRRSGHIDEQMRSYAKPLHLSRSWKSTRVVIASLSVRVPTFYFLRNTVGFYLDCLYPSP